MSTQFRLPRPAVASRLKKSRGLIAAALMAALILVPTASSGDYTDPSGDSGTAGDITSVTVASDKASGQLLFRIIGTNIASSETAPLILDIDSDANPLTGDITFNGMDYEFDVDNTSYGFFHWNGSDWVATPDLSVQVSGGTGQILISVNRSELGNASTFNFFGIAFNAADRAFDLAPDRGAFNYSLDANGPQILSVDVKKTPAAGPGGQALRDRPDRAEAPARRAADYAHDPSDELLVHRQARHQEACDRLGRLLHGHPEEEGKG
jgi:hypothetical protein